MNENNMEIIKDQEGKEIGVHYTISSEEQLKENIGEMTTVELEKKHAELKEQKESIERQLQIIEAELAEQEVVA
ncbi:MAG: DUF5320 domain-containing protein [Minisyncoccia bacterium]